MTQNPENKIEYKNEGVNYIATEEVVKKVPKATRGRVFKTSSPKIYVNDGSNGSNLKYTYSYPNYNSDSKPSVQNNYMNNFETTFTHNVKYTASDPLRLHETADHGGYSDYVTLRVKH